MSEMKTRGEILVDALVSAGFSIMRPSRAGGNDVYEKAATEYDKARAQLPEDVEAFLAEQENRINKGNGGADESDTRKMIAIIRAQGAEIATLKTAREFVDDQAWKISEERDALRARVSELESAARVLVERVRSVPTAELIRQDKLTLAAIAVDDILNKGAEGRR